MTEEKAFEPIDLSPELQKQSELKDLQWMKEHESSFAFPTFREETGDILVALNTRLMQYKGQFPSFSAEFRERQTLYDYRHELVILQSQMKMNEALPAAMVKGNGFLIYLAGAFFVIREK